MKFRTQDYGQGAKDLLFLEVDVVNGFQLGLPEDGRKIHGIGQGPPGTIIVAAGKDNIVQTLNLFKV